MQNLARTLWLLLLLSVCGGLERARAQTPENSATPAVKGYQAAGEKTPSEDTAIWDFHPLGRIKEQDNLYRSAGPFRDLIKAGKVSQESPEAKKAAADRMKSLFDRGIRTIVSLESDQAASKGDRAAWGALEIASAKEAGLKFVSCPMANSGKNSMQDMSDEAVQKQLEEVTRKIFEAAKDGGVVFHCAAGHDRTGTVVAYMRLKYQGWTAERAIEEMRSFGHNWSQFARPGEKSSWHEQHLRAIAAQLAKKSEPAPESQQ